MRCDHGWAVGDEKIATAVSHTNPGRDPRTALTVDDFELAAPRSGFSHHGVRSSSPPGRGTRTTPEVEPGVVRAHRLLPRVLEDVTAIDTKVTLFGQTMPSPFLLAPVAYQKLFHPEGEVEKREGSGAERHDVRRQHGHDLLHRGHRCRGNGPASGCRSTSRKTASTRAI